MDFSSVGDFLRKAASAKQITRNAIDLELSPLLEDDSTVGLPLSLGLAIDSLVEQYGDETYRQIALFSLGKWHQTHIEVLQQNIENDCMQSALLTMKDISTLSSLLQLTGQLSSFGGDEQWRAMLRDAIGQAVLERLEEEGLSPESFFAKDK